MKFDQLLWNDYATKYNKLAEKLEKANIDVGLLRAVVESKVKLERNYIHTLKSGERHA